LEWCLFLLFVVFTFIVWASETIQGGGAADYVLMELPTFLFMTIFSFLIYLLSKVIIAIYFKDSRAADYTILGTFIVVNIFVYLLFIMIIILFETLTDNYNSPCPGRVASTTDNSTQQTIRITYRAVVSAIALLLAFLFAVVGGTIYAKVVLLAKKTGTSTSSSKVFWVGAVCAVCFTCHAIILLIFAATDWESPYSIIFLIFIEVVPGCVMIFVLSPKKLSTDRVKNLPSSVSSTFSTSSTSSSSSSATSASSSSSSLASSSSDSSSD